MSDKLKIAIVDDHEMFRSGIKLVLEQKPDWQVIIEAINGIDFLNQLNQIVPDIVLLDLSMPKMNGYETTIRALKTHPELNIIILTMLSEEDYYIKMIQAGVKAFILKKSGTGELFRAIEEVSMGNNYFEQDILKNIVLKINTKEVDTLRLSEREKQVLNYICNGLTNKEIADKLFLSIKSIEKYRSGLLQKTNTRNSAHLVMFAFQNKLIEIPGAN
jgi:DNA-binding NarL/FixJ family response regulator